MKYDVTILTQEAYVSPTEVDDYINNVLTEDRLVKEALQALGLKVTRVSWDDPEFDWSETRSILFRTIWDYFDRFEEFEPWLKKASKVTKLINPLELIWWNIDKHYLADLDKWGANIVPTRFIETGDPRSLHEVVKDSGWENVVLKPAISGAARHTYKIKNDQINDHEEVFQKLVKSEAMMLQPFINSILEKGEVSHMVFDGKYTHSILKKAKPGDFRVQDDFGGSVELYQASEEEKKFAEQVIAKCKIKPLYARVDVVWDNNNELAVAELEVIEPELWFRFKPDAATQLANSIDLFLKETHQSIVS